jgi:predicted dehydrogenase
MPEALPAGELPVAVVGCGRMGKLHARVYSQLPGVKLVGIYDANPATAQSAASEYKTRAFDRLNDLVPLVKAISIATPTQFHASASEPFLARGIACLIEKPLARDTTEGTRIVDLAQAKGAIVQVGHIERFNPIVRALARLELSPRYIETIRISPMTFRSIDVGVVLDMMIHDIDIVLSLAKSKVKKVDASGVAVMGQAEDVCNARLTFENGCVANLTASRLALKTERKLRAFSPDAFVSIDYAKKTGVIARREGNLTALREAARKVKEGADPLGMKYDQLLKLEPLAIEEIEPIRAEIESFIAAARGLAPSAVSAHDGLMAVEVAQRIVAAIGDQSALADM